MRFVLSDKYNNEKDIIVLTHTNWDDWFTYETEYILDYIDQNYEKYRIGSIKIAHDGIVRKPNLPSQFESLDDSYYSLGTDSMYYETLLEIFSKDIERVTILNALKDVAINLERLNRVKDKDPFRTSLSRSVDIEKIQRQFHRLANGDSEKRRYKFLYKYAENDIAKHLEFKVNDKSSQIPSNVHAIIGRNGVGKSTLIKRFLEGLYNKDSDTLKIFEGKSETESELDLFFTKVISINFSIFDNQTEIDSSYISSEWERYIQITKDSNLEDFYKKKYGKDYKEKYEYILEHLSFYDEENNKVELNKVADKWVGIFIESLITCFKRKPYLWETLLKVLNTDPIFRKYECSRLYQSYIELKKNEYLRQFYNFFTKLSSGHKIVILTLTKVIEVVDEDVLVVIDEPELYLHPPLLSSYIRSLSILMEKRNGVAILATHSPIVIQELPNTCIYKLDRHGDILQASRLEIETFGQNISRLPAKQ